MREKTKMLNRRTLSFEVQFSGMSQIYCWDGTLSTKTVF